MIAPECLASKAWKFIAVWVAKRVIINSKEMC